MAERKGGIAPQRGWGSLLETAEPLALQRCSPQDPEPLQPLCSVQACKVQTCVPGLLVLRGLVRSSSHGKVPGRPGFRRLAGDVLRGVAHWCLRSSWGVACPCSPLSKFKCFTCGDCACVCVRTRRRLYSGITVGGWQSASVGWAVGDPRKAHRQPLEGGCVQERGGGHPSQSRQERAPVGC